MYYNSERLKTKLCQRHFALYTAVTIIQLGFSIHVHAQ